MATTKVAVAPLKVAQVRKPGGDFELVERETPKPNGGQVRIKVQACGVCHSDVFTKETLVARNSVSRRTWTRSGRRRRYLGH